MSSIPGNILSISIDGNRLSPEDAIKLFESPIHILGHAANLMRSRINNPDEVTYLIDRNINYTNICDIRCSFCAFSRDASSSDAYTLSEDELHQKLAETIDLGGSGILLQGGCNTSVRLDDIASMIRVIKNSFPQLRVHALSPPEIVFLSNLEGCSFDETITLLIAAGLDSLPGGGAEILVDSVRSKLAPKKCSTDDWLEVMRITHQKGLKTTATMMFGHIESRAGRVEHMLRIRNLQDETGGFIAFIPWTFQPGGTMLEGQVETASGVEYLRTLAISRLFLDNIHHIGASWLTQGLKLGQGALEFGADDIGSVMIEENVVAAAGCTNRTNEEELRRVICEAGYKPRCRDAVYNHVDRS